MDNEDADLARALAMSLQDAVEQPHQLPPSGPSVPPTISGAGTVAPVQPTAANGRMPEPLSNTLHAMYNAQVVNLVTHDDDPETAPARPHAAGSGDAQPKADTPPPHPYADAHGTLTCYEPMSYSPLLSGLTLSEPLPKPPPSKHGATPAKHAGDAVESSAGDGGHAAEPDTVHDLASHVRDWTAELHDILDLTPLSLEQAAMREGALTRISSAFVAACAPIAEILVAELPLADAQKSLPPIDIGGVAGGSKYILGGVLFKFAVDTEGLYGHNHSEAAKAAKAELRGISSITAAAVPGLRYPLHCVVDVLGYRVVATSLLPIGSDTLCYGSADGRVTVHDDEDALRSSIAQLAVHLNLARHPVGDKQLYLAGDVEGHCGRDGHMFLLDTARLMPPEAPPQWQAATCIVPVPGANDGVRLLRVPVDQRAAFGQHVWAALVGAALPDRVAPCEMPADPGTVLITSVLPFANVVCCALNVPAVLQHLRRCGAEASVLEHAERVLAQPTRVAAGLTRNGQPAQRGPLLMVPVRPKAAHLTQLLRPEAVQASPVPLSADAFTGWGSTDSHVYNPPVQHATDAMLERALPQLAAQLIERATGGRLAVWEAGDCVGADVTGAGRPVAHESLPSRRDDAFTFPEWTVERGEFSMNRLLRKEFGAHQGGAAGLDAEPGEQVAAPQPSLEHATEVLGEYAAQGYDTRATVAALQAHGLEAVKAVPLARGAPPVSIAASPHLPLLVPAVPRGSLQDDALAHALSSVDHVYVRELDWKLHLHSAGCNTRHLGRLAHVIRVLLQVHAEAVRRLPESAVAALRAMQDSMLAYGIARCFYAELRAALRGVTARVRDRSGSSESSERVLQSAAQLAHDSAEALFTSRLQYSGVGGSSYSSDVQEQTRLLASLLGKYPGLVPPEEWALTGAGLWAGLPETYRRHAFGIAQRLCGASMRFFCVDGVETFELLRLLPRRHAAQAQRRAALVGHVAAARAAKQLEQQVVLGSRAVLSQALGAAVADVMLKRRLCVRATPGLAVAHSRLVLLTMLQSPEDQVFALKHLLPCALQAWGRAIADACAGGEPGTLTLTPRASGSIDTSVLTRGMRSMCRVLEGCVEARGFALTVEDGQRLHECAWAVELVSQAVAALLSVAAPCQQQGAPLHALRVGMGAVRTSMVVASELKELVMPLVWSKCSAAVKRATARIGQEGVIVTGRAAMALWLLLRKLMGLEALLCRTAFWAGWHAALAAVQLQQLPLASQLSNMCNNLLQRTNAANAATLERRQSMAQLVRGWMDACAGSGSSIAAELQVKSADGNMPAWWYFTSLHGEMTQALWGHSGETDFLVSSSAASLRVAGDVDERWQVASDGHSVMHRQGKQAMQEGPAESGDRTTRDVGMLALGALLQSSLGRTMQGHGMTFEARSCLAGVRASHNKGVTGLSSLSVYVSHESASSMVASSMEHWLPSGHALYPVEVALTGELGGSNAGSGTGQQRRDVLFGVNLLMMCGLPCVDPRACHQAALYCSSPALIPLHAILPRRGSIFVQTGCGVAGQVTPQVGPEGMAHGAGVLRTAANHSINSLKSIKAVLAARHPLALTCHTNAAYFLQQTGLHHSALLNTWRALRLAPVSCSGRTSAAWPGTGSVQGAVLHLTADACRRQQWDVAVATCAVSLASCAGLPQVAAYEELLALHDVHGPQLCDEHLVSVGSSSALARAVTSVLAVQPASVSVVRCASAVPLLLRSASLLLYHVAEAAHQAGPCDIPAGPRNAKVTLLPYAGEWLHSACGWSRAQAVPDVIAALWVWALQVVCRGVLGKLPPLPDDLAARVQGVQAAAMGAAMAWCPECPPDTHAQRVSTDDAAELAGVRQGLGGLRELELLQAQSANDDDEASKAWLLEHPLLVLAAARVAVMGGWLTAAEMLGEVAESALAQTLPLGRDVPETSGTPGAGKTALAQMASVQAARNMARVSRALEPAVQELLQLGFAREECVAGVLATSSLQLAPSTSDFFALSQAVMDDQAHPSMVAQLQGGMAGELELDVAAAAEWLLQDLEGRMQADVAHSRAETKRLAAWAAQAVVQHGEMPPQSLLDLADTGEWPLSQLSCMRADDDHEVPTASPATREAPHDDDATGGEVGQAPSVPAWNPPPAQVQLQHLNGRAAISHVMERLYPDQTNPTEYTALTKWSMGGPDPLDYVTVYRNPGDPAQGIPPHWHYVSQGLCNLLSDTAVHPMHPPRMQGKSGFGMEFTMRVARESWDTEIPPSWPATVLNSLARYTHHSKTVIGASDFVQSGMNTGFQGAALSQKEAEGGSLAPSNLSASVRNGELLAANLPHIATCPDPDLPTITCETGEVSFHQVVGVADREYEIARSWSTGGALHLLRHAVFRDSTGKPVSGMTRGALRPTATVGGASDPWAQCRTRSGAFLPGPYLITDPRRTCDLASIDPTVQATVRDRIATEGSSLGIQTGCLVWRPRVVGMTLADSLAFVAVPGSAMPGVEVLTTASVASLLSVAMLGRLRQGMPFILECAHPAAHQAKDTTKAREDAQRLGGWGLSRLVVIFVSDDCDESRVRRVANAEAPFVVTEPGVLQVYLSREAAGVIGAYAAQPEHFREQSNMPLTASWPSVAPGFTVTVVRGDEDVFPAFVEDSPVLPRSMVQDTG